MTDHAAVSIVDGNAVAGMLSGVLTGDPTMIAVTCGCCGERSVLAEAVVEREPTSALVRCRSCTHTLFTLADEADAVVLRVGALDLRLPR